GDERLPIARNRISRLEKRLPYLVVRSKGDVPRTTVMRDGVELGVASLGSAQPVDPGEHVIRVYAPDHVDATFRVTVAEGETRTQEVTPGPLAPAAPARTDTRGTEPRSVGSSQRTLSYITGAAGVLGLAVGSVFGVLAKVTYDQAKKECGGDPGRCSSP